MLILANASDIRTHASNYLTVIGMRLFALTPGCDQ